MKFLAVAVLVCLAVAVYGQAQQAGAAAGAAAAAQAQQAAAGARGRGGMGNLLTLGVLSGNMGGDAMRDMMYCQMLGISPIFCMGMM